MTLNGIMTVILRYFSEFGSFRGALRKVVEDILNFLRQKCSPKHLVFSDVSLTMIRCREPLHRGGGLNARVVAKYNDFGLIEGYISETVQDRR